VPSFRDLPPDALRAHRETVLLRLLLRTSQIEINELVRRLRARGHATQTSYIGVLGNVDTEGTRLVTLAGRLGTSRQAAGQLVSAIESAGFLERVPDPDDRRGVLVRHTIAGRNLLADALTDMADIEAGYADLIGPSRMKALKRALAEIADATDPVSALRRR